MNSSYKHITQVPATIAEEHTQSAWDQTYYLFSQLSWSHAITLGLASLILYYICTSSSPRGRLPLPDGPRGLPIVGTSKLNIYTSFRCDLTRKQLQGSFPFLTKYPELVLDRWAKTFGDVYSLWLGNQLFIIVSNPQIAKDLMITNGAIFSSRKEMFIKSQTVFAGRGITATPYNDRW